MFDEDIKIAELGNIKSKTSSSNKNKGSFHEEYNRESSKGNTEKAKALGKALADSVVENLNAFTVEKEEQQGTDMQMQKGVLMTFAATVCIEAEFTSTVVSQTAKNSFNSELEKISPMLYKAVGDSGAFSFYYLAYRRGTEVDRRIGQTFAMLCSHDGDPVYQELGEAIYCWFISKTEKYIKNAGITD